MVIKTDTPKFAYDNIYITPGLVDELYETLKYMRLSDCKRFMEELGSQYTLVTLKTGDCVTIDDLVCMFGQDAYADACGPVGFYAGPELWSPPKSKQYPFKFIKGTVLHWVMDLILYEVSQKGYKVFQRLDIPL